MNRIVLSVLIGMFGAAAAGCNTTRGIGQDIEATGEKIEEVAEETKDRMSGDDDEG